MYKWTLRGANRQETRYSTELSQGEGESYTCKYTDVVNYISMSVTSNELIHV